MAILVDQVTGLVYPSVPYRLLTWRLTKATAKLALAFLRAGITSVLYLSSTSHWSLLQLGLHIAHSEASWPMASCDSRIQGCDPKIFQ